MLVLSAVMLIYASLAPSVSAQVEVEKRPPGAGAMTYDLVLLRPLGIAATIGGGAIFVVSLPFSAIGGNVGRAWEALFVQPVAFTFARPLGAFRYNPDW